MKVEIAFDLSANGIGDWFTLDDDTMGVLDNVTYLLAGDVLVDVTDYVRSVSTKRGRSQQLQRFTSGTANLTLDNRTRLFDPTNATGPYYGQLVPRKQVRISHLDVPIWTGQVEDWNLNWTIGGDATADVACTDGFSTLAKQNVTAGTRTPETAAERVDRSLDEVGWPTALRAISATVTHLGADVVSENTNALQYLGKIEAGEAGAMFMDRDGMFTFLTRGDLEELSTDVPFGPSGIPFIDIGNVYGTEELWNVADVATTDGTVTSINTASVAQYGEISTSIDTLLSGNVEGGALGASIVARYGQPVERINSIKVRLDGLTSDQRAIVMAREMGDGISVRWTPAGVGAAVNQYLVIDGIEHDARPSGPHDVSFALSQTVISFRLDDPAWGVLDTNTLGY